MADKHYPIYKTEECITDADCGFRLALVENREFSPIEHAHDFYEIVSVLSGTIHHKINGRNYIQRVGDICILRPGERHLLVRQSENYLTAVTSVAKELIEPFFTAYNIDNRLAREADPILYRIHTQQLQVLKQLMEQLRNFAGQQNHNLCRVITGLLLQLYVQSHVAKHVDWIDQITEKMNTPDNLALGVPALQKITNLSHSQLCRVFHRILDKTPQQYIKELRLNYAYTMICNTSEPFETIAAMVGYSSFSHFSIIFKEHFRQSPSALRKETAKYF